MNKRKIMTVAMALCMCAVLAIGGTLAYFTDEDNRDNTFTFGNVQIEQIEQERGEEGLKDFTHDKVMMPIVGNAQGEKDEYGMPTAKNYVDKIVTVKNTGKSDAWMRTFILIPLPLVVEGPDLSESPMHCNIGNRYDPTGAGSLNSVTTAASLEAWDWDYANRVTYPLTETVEIGGINYAVECYTVKAPVAAGTTTDAVIVGVYLDNDIDFDPDKQKYIKVDPKTGAISVLDQFMDAQNKVHVYAFTQAVQAAGFEESSAAAFAAAGLNKADGTTPAIEFLEDVTWVH